MAPPRLTTTNPSSYPQPSSDPATGPQYRQASRPSPPAPLPSNFSSASTVVANPQTRNRENHISRGLRDRLPAGAGDRPGTGVADERRDGRVARRAGRSGANFIAPAESSRAGGRGALTVENLQVHDYANTHDVYPEIANASLEQQSFKDLPPQQAIDANQNLMNRLLMDTVRDQMQVTNSLGTICEPLIHGGSITADVPPVVHHLMRRVDQRDMVISQARAAVDLNIKIMQAQQRELLNQSMRNLKAAVQENCENLPRTQMAGDIGSRLKWIEEQISLMPEASLQSEIRTAIIDGLLSAIPGLYEHARHKDKNKSVSQVAKLLVKLVNEAEPESLSQRTRALAGDAVEAQKKYARIFVGIKREIPAEKNILLALQTKLAMN